MPDLILSASDVVIQAKAGKPPKVSMLAYSGGVMTPPGFGPVVIDLDGLTLPDSTPLLADHASRLEGIVGHGRAFARSGQLYAEGDLTTATPAGKQVLALAKEGFPFQASVGVQPGEREYIRGGQTVEVNGRLLKAEGNGFTLIKTGELKEISILPLGADNKTSVSIAAKHKDDNMTFSEWLKAKGFTEADLDETQTATLRASYDAEQSGDDLDRFRHDAAAETERIALIRATCRGSHPSIEAQAIREGWDRNRTELAVLRAERATGPVIHGNWSGSAPTSRDVITAGILSHMGREKLAEETLGERTTQQGRDLRASSMLDFLKAALQLDGVEPPRGQAELIRAGFSTVSLPTILGGVADKVLFDAYNSAPASWRSFAAIRSAENFREHTGVRLSASGEMEKVGQDGELKHHSLSEDTYNFQVATYGRMLTLTRQQIINDDLGAFDDAARMMGAAAMRKVNDVFYETLLANGGSFFDNDNDNLLTGTDSALSITALGSAIATMVSRTDDEGRNIDIPAKVLVVPPELEVTARQLIASAELQLASDESGGTGNPFHNRLQLEIEPRLSNSNYTGYSSTAWYLFGPPTSAPVITAYLQGKQGPNIEFFDMSHNVNQLAVSWRCYLDFGVALGDYRAAVKNTGVAS